MLNQIFIVSFFISCISFCFKVSAQVNPSDSSNWGNVYVTTWANDCQSAFSFSFDDGFISQYEHVRDILNQNDFPATYFILPPFLTDTLPGIWRYGTWPMFLEMYSGVHELGSHSLNHPDLTQLPVGDTLTPNTIHYELYHSKKMINERTQSNDCIGFAFPFAIHNDLVDSLTGLYYEFSREVGIFPNPHSIFGKDWYKLSSFQVEFDMPRDSLENDLDELYDFINWIDNSILNRTWGIHLAHEVVPFAQISDLLNNGSYHPISNEWLSLLCDWLKEKSDMNKIWIETIANVSKYIKERIHFSYNIISKTNNLIEIDLTDTLADEIYNYPLSAYIAVPETWEFVLVEQGSGANILESVYADSMQLILANVTPDGGIIKLTEFDPSYVADQGKNEPDIYSLAQNYPNPFNSKTNISFILLKSSLISLKVHDVLGNEITTLVNEQLPAGSYVLEFNDRPDGVQYLPSGVYIYTLSAGVEKLSRKMILLK